MPGRSPWRLSPTRHCLPAVALLVLSVHTLLACRLGRIPASGYSLRPLTQLYGVEVLGLDLTADLSPEVQDRLKHDLARHRLLLFRGPGVSAERHVTIARWLGKTSTVGSSRHRKAPHDHLFRLSNDDAEGVTGVASEGGFHIDGASLMVPHYYSLWTMIHTIQGGDTHFVSLPEVVARLPPEQRRRWERLWVQWPTGITYPLLYSHPLTGETTICLTTGNLRTGDYVWDADTPRQRVADKKEWEQLLQEVRAALEEYGTIYKHQWRDGDFIIADNRAVGHRAVQASFLPREQVGLRVLHRVTVGGPEAPRKRYLLDEEGNVVSGEA